MKKIIFFCVVLCMAITVKSQCWLLSQYPCNEDSVNMRQYEDRYLINYCGREELNLDAVTGQSDNGGIIDGVGAYGISTYILQSEAQRMSYNISLDLAQPYIVDTPITIAGVSGYVGHWTKTAYCDYYKWYFEIWDSTLTNVLRSVDITDYTATRYIYKTPYYTESFFDEPLTISGKFYVVYHTPDTLRTPLNSFDMVGGFVLGSTTCTPPEDLYPLVTTYDDGFNDDHQRTWMQVNYASRLATALYLFPILGDTTSSGDTIASDLESVNNLEAVRVFPNPTDNEVNINSGYKIERIFLYDESGKILQEKEVKAYNYKIDLQHYPQGSYLLKVQTTKNQSPHKIIKQ